MILIPRITNFSPRIIFGLTRMIVADSSLSGHRVFMVEWALGTGKPIYPFKKGSNQKHTL